ncbi:MAG: hypothetical protein WBG86_21025, partial [Polyangiales bacterium]
MAVHWKGHCVARELTLCAVGAVASVLSIGCGDELAPCVDGSPASSPSVYATGPRLTGSPTLSADEVEPGNPLTPSIPVDGAART